MIKKYLILIFLFLSIFVLQQKTLSKASEGDVNKIHSEENGNAIAIITKPENKDNITGEIDIIGKASSNNFDYFLIEIKENKQDAWKIIKKSHEQVTEVNTLVKWNSYEVPNGKYDIKLTVIDTDKNFSEDIISDIYIKNHSGKFKLKVPNKGYLEPVNVKTTEQIVYGNIGDKNKKIELTDDRGTNEGWSITMTVSDFYTTGSLISVSNLSIKPSDIEVINGSIDGVYKGNYYTFTSESDPATVMYANAGYGNGTYLNTVDLILHLPANIKAGEYKAIIDFSVQ